MWILALAMALFYQFGAAAQTGISIAIDDVNSEAFPRVEVVLSFSDNMGYALTGLTGDNLSLSEDGNVVPDFEISSVFQRPISLALVVDTSESMGYRPTPTRMEATVSALSEFIEALGSEDEVALIGFSDEPVVVQGLTTDRDLIREGLQALEPVGNAALNDALGEAVDLLKNSQGRRLIILITDGRESGLSFLSADEVTLQAQQAGVTIYPLGFEAVNIDPAAMEKFAALTQGEFREAPDAAAINVALNQILPTFNTKFREQYVITFDSGLPADNLEHELVVTVDYQGKNAEQSRRFVAVPNTLVLTLPDLDEDQVVGGMVYLAPEVVSPAPLASLEILLDGEPLTSIFTPPFDYSWDSTTVEPGLHEFTLIATDGAGNSGQISKRLDVQPPITVEIENPEEGATLSGSATVRANVASQSKVARVEIRAAGSALTTVEIRSETVYEAEWDLEGVTPGTHVIRVSAVDANGFSDEASLNVNVALPPGGLGVFWIALIAVLAVGAIIVPLGLRRRRRLAARKAPATTAGLGGEPLAASLRELEGVNPNQKWRLSAGEVRLGRKRDENDIFLKGLKASRKHALIRAHEGRHVISSLNPQNPVLINDRPAQQHVLQDGDVIRAGESVFRYEV